MINWLKWNLIQILGFGKPHCPGQRLTWGLTEINSQVNRYIECCKVAASFVNSNWENVTIVRNTTQGIQAVLNCFPKLKKCLINSHTYNAMRNSVDLHSQRYLTLTRQPCPPWWQRLDNPDSRINCEYVEVEIPMPIESEDQIVEAFTKTMDQNPDIDFAIIGLFFIYES